MSFDVACRPWLPVVYLDGESVEVPLRQLLLDARRIRRIVGESPPMTAALYRLVLAVALRAYRPRNRESWVELWEAEDLPAEPLDAYLQKHPGRFDLFHPERPFLQCKAVSASGRSSPAKLIAYRAVGNNATLFDHTTVTDQVVLEPAQAARWLVTLQAYDTGGLKTPYGNRGTKSSERAPCNLFSVCLVEGRDLKETLLLNTPLYNPFKGKPTTTTSPEDRPVWEDTDPPDPKRSTRSPLGWTDVLTWPSRRVWLSTAQPAGGGTVVDQVVVTPGTQLRADLHDVEHMAAYQKPAGARGTPVRRASLRPVRLHEIRGVWRYSVELLLTDPTYRLRPLALDHIAEMARARHIPADTVYTLRIFGQHLDTSGGGSIRSWQEEAVPAPVALLRSESNELARIIGAAVKYATAAGEALARLAQGHRDEFHALRSLRRTAVENLAANCELAYWPRLSKPFGEFLIALGEAHHAKRPETAAVDHWGQVVFHTADRAANQWAMAAPSHYRTLKSTGKQLAGFGRNLWRLRKTFEAETAKSITQEHIA